MSPNVAIDFEIISDPQDSRTPAELMQQIENALRSSSSVMRSGPSGFLLDGATLEVLPSSGIPVDLSVPASVFQPSGPPPAMMPVPEVPVPRENVDELLGRVSVLSVELDDERQMKERLEGQVLEMAKRLEAAESSVVDKMKEVDAVTVELEKVRRDVVYTKDQLDVSLKNLAQAKEMWMKESARATRLREQLDQAELSHAEKEKQLVSLASSSKKIETENSNLKHLLNRSNEIVSTQVIVPESMEHSFAQSDSYFVRTGPSKVVLTNHHLLPPASARSPVGEPPLSMLPIGSGHTKFLQLCLANDGVLFEDEIIQIGIKAKFSGLGEGVLGVYYGNKTSGTLQSLQTRFEGPGLHLTVSPIPSQMGPKSQICQRVSVQLGGPFVDAPKFTVSFLLPDNTPRTIPLQLPVTINKFIQQRSLSGDEFFSNWRQQIFLLNEASAVVSVAMNLAQIARASTLGGALQLHHQIDSVPDNLVLAGQFPSDSADGIRCVSIPEALVLVRIEVGSGPTHAGKTRIAVRSNDSVVAHAVLVCISQQISI